MRNTGTRVWRNCRNRETNSSAPRSTLRNSVRVLGVMISTISVSLASSNLLMRARSVASSSPFCATCSTRVRNSSILSKLSAGFSSPTIRVVRRSETSRIAPRRGATSRIHKLIGTATIVVLNRTGFETAIVFGIISPNSKTSGTITMMLIQTARSSP